MNGKAKSLLVLATLSGLAIHVINRIEYSQANSKGNVSHVENRYYEWRFGKIKYTKRGSYGAEDNANLRFDSKGNIIYKYYFIPYIIVL